MEQFLSTKEAADKWGISKRRVQILCKERRIIGAKKQSGVWLIPAGTSKPMKLVPGKKQENQSELRVLSLFSGCGGMDLGFEGGFQVLNKSINPNCHPDWAISVLNDSWVQLGRTRFKTVFANDIKPEAKAAWSKYFAGRGTDVSVYYLDSIVDLVKLQKNNKINIFRKR